jgi:hypothetical protein
MYRNIAFHPSFSLGPSLSVGLQAKEKRKEVEEKLARKDLTN